jgi:uncharacterized membrane protein
MFQSEEIMTRKIDIRRYTALLIIFFILGISFSCNSKPVYSSPPVEDGEVVINVGLMEDARPEFYSITLKGKRIDFFVFKLNGVVESYFDACAKCYPYRMGYVVEGFYLRCKYCNKRYPLDTLKTGIGSCYPLPLNGRLRGDEYHISLSELTKGGKYF